MSLHINISNRSNKRGKMTIVGWNIWDSLVKIVMKHTTLGNVHFITRVLTRQKYIIFSIILQKKNSASAD